MKPSTSVNSVNTFHLRNSSRSGSGANPLHSSRSIAFALSSSVREQDMEIPYSSPVSPSLYSFLAICALAIGLLFTAMYFVYQMKSDKRNIFVELIIALASSGALGVGVFFLMLSFDLYV
eukprot:gene2006-2189_t